LLIVIDPRLAAAEEETIGGGNIEDTNDSIYIPKMDRKSGPQDRGPGNRFPVTVPRIVCAYLYRMVGMLCRENFSSEDT